HRVIGLNISSFNLQGTITPQLGNLSSLQTLDLSHNKLSGNIPSSIFNMHTLKLLDFSDNQLFGSLSSFIFNMSSMTTIDLSINRLSGELPANICKYHLYLKELFLDKNMFHGRIPSTLSKCKQLEELNLGFNNLSGAILKEIGNLTKLKEIISTITNSTFVNIADNYLTSSTPELSFLSSLTNCKKLKVLIVTGNPLDGILPKSIGNFSLSLETILMANCSISGNIPQVVGNLSNLLVLELGGNNLTGPIPVTFSQLQTLQAFGLTRNKLAGPITDELCHLARLHSLVLQGNKFSGSIPSCLGNLTSVRVLYLGLNIFTSVLSSTIWNLKDILFIDVSSNFLDGPLSLDIGNLKVVIGLDFSRNNLSSDIPITIGGLKNLQQMLLEYNRLEGSIPESFEGEIPRGGPFANLTAKSFMGNELLCGLPDLQVSPCKPNKPNTHKKSRKMLLLVIVLPLSTALIVVVTLTLKWKLIKCWKSRTGPSNDVFHQQYERALKSFEDECEVRKRIRHRNLLLSGEDQLSKQTQTLATIGYMAPEYGTKGRVSTRGDVCSFGIMLMEIVWGIYFDKASHDEQISGIRIP
ncbi:hypothetical protein CICLE_v10007091mg, partial [Citrus x clementina]